MLLLRFIIIVCTNKKCRIHLNIALAEGDSFVASNVRQGILPIILSALINARAATRKVLKDTADTAQRAVLDSRQKALKTTANALYGFTGTSCSVVWHPISWLLIRHSAVITTDKNHYPDCFPIAWLLLQSWPSAGLTNSRRVPGLAFKNSKSLPEKIWARHQLNCCRFIL